jgi:hypothetical protein
VKNKGAAIAVCSIILIISVAYYFNAQSNRSGTDIMAIDKNWWDDPNEQEKKFEEQYNFIKKSPAETNSTSDSNSLSTEELRIKSDHYQEMNQLKQTHSKRYLELQTEMANLKSQLQHASSTQLAAELKRQISIRQSKMKEMKEDDQFIQFITGQ